MSDSGNEEYKLEEKELVISKSRLLQEGLAIKTGEKLVITVVEDEKASE